MATDAKFANIIPEDVAFNIDMSEADLRDTESELRSISELALQRDSDAHATLIALANTLVEFDDTDEPEVMRTAAENVTANSTRHTDPVLMGNEMLSRDPDRLIGPPPPMRKADGDKLSMNQLRTIAATSKADLIATLSDRYFENQQALSVGYLGARLSIVRNMWVYFATSMGVSPVRKLWPSDPDGAEDMLMQGFALYCSLRYLTWGSVAAAKAHVLEWHAATLGIMAPPMPKTVYVLAKLKKTLAVERPLGKDVRTGFTNIEIKKIFDLGWACVDDETDPIAKADAANAMAALGMIFEQGERPGHLLPDTWRAERHLSRAHLLVFLTEQGNSAMAEAAIIPRPDSKTTTSTSEAARAKANEPYVADMQSTHSCDGAIWFPKLDAADPVRGAEARATPAFRTAGNKCLTTKQAATTLRHLCRSLGIDEGRRLISLYSFRITAFNLMKEAERTGLVPVLTEDQRNKICSESHHTRFSTTQLHYVQANIIERVALRRGARLAVLTPIQSFTSFHQNKSIAKSFVVGIDENGVQTVLTGPEAAALYDEDEITRIEENQALSRAQNNPPPASSGEQRAERGGLGPAANRSAPDAASTQPAAAPSRLTRGRKRGPHNAPNHGQSSATERTAAGTDAHRDETDGGRHLKRTRSSTIHAASTAAPVTVTDGGTTRVPTNSAAAQAPARSNPTAMDVDWDAEWDSNSAFFAKRDKDGLTIDAWSTRFTKVVTEACNARSLAMRRITVSDDQLRRYKKPQVVSSIMSCVGPKGVASLHKLLSAPDGITGDTDIERLSDQIDDAQAKFEVAAHTDSIAKGDKVYVGAAIQALRFAHPALATAANQRDADKRQDDADDSDDESAGWLPPCFRPAQQHRPPHQTVATVPARPASNPMLNSARAGSTLGLHTGGTTEPELNDVRDLRRTRPSPASQIAAKLAGPAGVAQRRAVAQTTLQRLAEAVAAADEFDAIVTALLPHRGPLRQAALQAERREINNMMHLIHVKFAYAMVQTRRDHVASEAPPPAQHDNRAHRPARPATNPMLNSARAGSTLGLHTGGPAQQLAAAGAAPSAPAPQLPATRPRPNPDLWGPALWRPAALTGGTECSAAPASPSTSVVPAGEVWQTGEHETVATHALTQLLGCFRWDSPGLAASRSPEWHAAYQASPDVDFLGLVASHVRHCTDPTAPQPPTAAVGTGAAAAATAQPAQPTVQRIKIRARVRGQQLRSMMRDKPVFTKEQFIALTEHQSAAMTAFDVVLWTIAKVAVWHFNFLTQVAVICNGKRYSLVTKVADMARAHGDDPIDARRPTADIIIAVHDAPGQTRIRYGDLLLGRSGGPPKPPLDLTLSGLGFWPAARGAPSHAQVDSRNVRLDASVQRHTGKDGRYRFQVQLRPRQRDGVAPLNGAVFDAEFGWQRGPHTLYINWQVSSDGTTSSYAEAHELNSLLDTVDLLMPTSSAAKESGYVTIIRADAYLEHGYTNQSYDGNNFQYHRPDHLAVLPRSTATPLRVLSNDDQLPRQMQCRPEHRHPAPGAMVVTVTATLSRTKDATSTQEVVVQFARASETDKGAPAPGDTAVLTPAGTPSHHHEQHIGEQHRYTNVNVKRKNIAVFPGDEDTMAVLKYAEEAAQGADQHGLVHIYREMLRNRLLQRLYASGFFSWDEIFGDTIETIPDGWSSYVIDATKIRRLRQRLLKAVPAGFSHRSTADGSDSQSLDEWVDSHLHLLHGEHALMMSGLRSEGFTTPKDLIGTDLHPWDMREIFPQAPRLQHLMRALMMAVGLNECRANMLTAAAGHERHAPLASAQTASLVPPEAAWPTIQWATASNLHATNYAEWTAPCATRWAREARDFTWHPVGGLVDDLINAGLSFIIGRFGPQGQPTLFDAARGTAASLTRPRRYSALVVTRTEHRQPVYIPISDEQPDRRDESDESGSDDEDSDADDGGATEHMVQIKDNDANFSKFEIQSTRAEGLRPAAFSPDPQSQSDGAIRHKWSEWVLCFHADVSTVSQRQAYNKWMTDETERLAFTARHPAIARRITVYSDAMPAAISLDTEAAAGGADRTTQLYASLIDHLQTDLNDNAQPSGNCEDLDQMLHDQWAETRHRLGSNVRSAEQSVVASVDKLIKTALIDENHGWALVGDKAQRRPKRQRDPTTAAPTAKKRLPPTANDDPATAALEEAAGTHPLQHLVGMKLEFQSDATLYDHDIATGTCVGTVTHCSASDASLCMMVEGSDAGTGSLVPEIPDLLLSGTMPDTVKQVDWCSQRQVNPDGSSQPRIVTFAVVVSAGRDEVHLSLPVTATVPALVSAIKRACNAKAVAIGAGRDRRPDPCDISWAAYDGNANLRAFTGRRNLDTCSADTTILDCAELVYVQGPIQPGSAPPAVKITIVNAGTGV